MTGPDDGDVILELRNITKAYSGILAVKKADAARNGQIDTVEFAYVDGSEGVRTETFASEDIDGVKIRATLDFAAKVIDWRGLAKANGAT